MGQRIVGQETPWWYGCGSLIGILLVGVVLVALIAWLTLADWS